MAENWHKEGRRGINEHTLMNDQEMIIDIIKMLIHPYKGKCSCREITHKAQKD